MRSGLTLLPDFRLHPAPAPDSTRQIFRLQSNGADELLLYEVLQGSCVLHAGSLDLLLSDFIKPNTIIGGQVAMWRLNASNRVR